jgi:hypothetical protein
MTNKVKIYFVGLTLLVTAVLIAIQYGTTYAKAQDISATELAASAYSCRSGLSSLSSLEDQWLDYFKAGWTLNFSTSPASTSNLNALNSTFTPMVRIKQNRDSNGNYLNSYYTVPSISVIRQVAGDYPGRLWFLGNEPDRVLVQDDINPQMYAVGFHDVAAAIKQEDPTALIAIAGLIQPTAGRLQYLDIVWDTYVSLYNEPMPVDVWNMHGYILAEVAHDGGVGPARVALGTDPSLAVKGSDLTPKSCNLQSNPNLHTDNIYCYSEHDSQPILRQHIINMRTWMKEHGQQNKPLVINEYGSLFTFWDFDDPINPTHCYLQDENGKCFTEPRVSNHMIASANLFETFTDPTLGYPDDGYRMVQQWLWFTLFTDSTGESSNLLVDNYTDFAVGNPAALTQVGQTFKTLVNNESLSVNLKPVRIPSLAAYRESGTVTVNLTASMLNTGNLDQMTPVNISFYADSSLTQLIGTVSWNTLIRGCGLPNFETTVSVPWQLTSPGVHRFWVKVDSSGIISESNESDNVAQSVVIVDPINVYAPIVRR